MADFVTAPMRLPAGVAAVLNDWDRVCPASTPFATGARRVSAALMKRRPGEIDGCTVEIHCVQSGPLAVPSLVMSIEKLPGPQHPYRLDAARSLIFARMFVLKTVTLPKSARSLSVQLFPRASHSDGRSMIHSASPPPTTVPASDVYLKHAPPFEVRFSRRTVMAGSWSGQGWASRVALAASTTAFAVKWTRAC